jgi:5-methylcytosine-specific restriction endonuclease McrA
MNSSTNAAVSFSQATSPAELSDTELLAATRRLVGRSNQLLAALLEHLGEVEARGIHRTRACSGLYAYCIFELRFSEDEAYRRVAASRLVRRFPALLAAIASGELHLTGLLQLGPHLTGENLREVLDRAKHRTKKEIARLVRVLDPLPDVLPRIEPLGPASATLVPRTPTWPEFVASMCPVRDLAPGERPRDWTEGTLEASTFEGPANFAGHEGAPGPAWPIELDASAESAPARLEPQRYGIQFTANEEYVKLVAEAQALLSRFAPRATLDELHLRAMRALVAELKRQKYAATNRPRKRSSQTIPPGASPVEASPLPETSETSETSALAERSHATAGTDLAQAAPYADPRRRGRYVPAAVRRAVFQRDDGRCTYTAAAGQRCHETRGLELHHVTAFAQGGEHTEANLTLRCRAHNALAAEEDFGRNFVERARGSNDHEPWVRARAGCSIR